MRFSTRQICESSLSTQWQSFQVLSPWALIQSALTSAEYTCNKINWSIFSVEFDFIGIWEVQYELFKNFRLDPFEECSFLYGSTAGGTVTLIIIETFAVTVREAVTVNPYPKHVQNSKFQPGSGSLSSLATCTSWLGSSSSPWEPSPRSCFCSHCPAFWVLWRDRHTCIKLQSKFAFYPDVVSRIEICYFAAIALAH